MNIDYRNSDRKPAQGDRRYTKAHGEQVRVFARNRAGNLLMGGGHRYHLFDWVGIDELYERGCGYLLTDADRRKLDQQEFIRTCRHEIETSLFL